MQLEKKTILSLGKMIESSVYLEFHVGDVLEMKTIYNPIPMFQTLHS